MLRMAVMWTISTSALRFPCNHIYWSTQRGMATFVVFFSPCPLVGHEVRSHRPIEGGFWMPA